MVRLQLLRIILLIPSQDPALVGIGTSLSSAEQTDLTPGVTMLQEGNSGFSATLDSVVGSIGIGSDLTLTAVGSGFTTPYTAYDNVSLIAITGEGTGGKVELSVQNGVAVAATASVGGTGYASGDALLLTTMKPMELVRTSF